MERTPAGSRILANRARFPTLTPMPTIDLNAALGEGGTHDTALIALASSANIACGCHAGDETTMRRAVEACIARGAAIGAHPGYEDREHFGRIALNLPPAEVAESLKRQIGKLMEITRQAGAQVHHVKPHGALYNQADRDPALAAAVAAAVASVLPGCCFYVPPSGALAAAGEAAGLRVRAEGFADRLYQPDGSLTPRAVKGAVIDDVATAVAQAMQIATRGEVVTSSGARIPLRAETLCVHGDGGKAVELLEAVRRALEAEGFTIRA